MFRDRVVDILDNTSTVDSYSTNQLTTYTYVQSPYYYLSPDI